MIGSITRKKILPYSFITLGALLFVNAVSATITTGINAGTAMTFFLSLLLLLFGLFFHKLRPAFRITFYILLALGVAFAAFVPIYGSIDSANHREDTIIVLGAGLRGEEPSASLKSRLDSAYNYAKKNPSALVVVSGGQGKNEIISEAEAMKRYLVKKGLSEERIIKEDRSTSTRENLAFSKEILDSLFEKEYRVAVVSNDYHVLRAKSLAREVGFSAPTHISGATPFSVFVPSVLRECLALIRLWVFGI